MQKIGTRLWWLKSQHLDGKQNTDGNSISYRGRLTDSEIYLINLTIVNRHIGYNEQMRKAIAIWRVHYYNIWQFNENKTVHYLHELSTDANHGCA